MSNLREKRLEQAVVNASAKLADAAETLAQVQLELEEIYVQLLPADEEN